MAALVEFGFNASAVHAGIGKLENRLKTFERAPAGITSGFNAMANSVKGLLPAMGVGMVVGGIRSILGEMDDLADTALKLNETTEVIQRVAYASDLLAGVDINSVAGSFLKLEKALGDVENAAARQALERYGITAGQLTRLPLDEKILILAAAFKRARQDGTGYNDILALLGKSAGDLIPMFEQTEETLKDTFANAAPVADDMVQRMAALNDRVDQFTKNSKSNLTSLVGYSLKAVDAYQAGVKAIFSGGDVGSAVATAFMGEPPPEEDTNQTKRDEKAKNLEKETAAANQQKVLLEMEREREKVAAATAALGERQFKAMLDNMTPANAVAAVEKRIADEKERQARADVETVLTDLEKIAHQEKLLDLADQLRQQRQRLQQQESKAQDDLATATDKAKQESDSRFDQQAALNDYLKEQEILRDIAAGHQKAADAKQRALEIDREKARLIEQMGMDEDEALALATKNADLKKKIAGDKDGSGKIYGYSQAQGDAASKRAAANAAVKSHFGGLDAYDAMQKTRLGDTWQFPALDAMAGKSDNPLAAQAAANAKDKGGSKSDRIEDLLEINNKLLAAVLGGSS